MALTIAFSLTLLGQVLPGSTISLEEAREAARFIVIAEPVGFGLIIGTGAVSFMSGLELEPSRVLKGRLEAGNIKGLSVSAAGPETLPTKKGDSYVFFINDYKGHLQVLKMLPKTEVDIEAVEREMGRARIEAYRARISLYQDAKPVGPVTIISKRGPVESREPIDHGR